MRQQREFLVTWDYYKWDGEQWVAEKSVPYGKRRTHVYTSWKALCQANKPFISPLPDGPKDMRWALPTQRVRSIQMRDVNPWLPWQEGDEIDLDEQAFG